KGGRILDKEEMFIKWLKVDDWKDIEGLIKARIYQRHTKVRPMVRIVLRLLPNGEYMTVAAARCNDWLAAIELKHLFKFSFY
ncbi:hypothetical protein HKBW3S03_01608, partial [Candidatus Hakubella thermalkaliphila]